MEVLTTSCLLAIWFATSIVIEMVFWGKTRDNNWYHRKPGLQKWVDFYPIFDLVSDRFPLSLSGDTLVCDDVGEQNVLEVVLCLTKWWIAICQGHSLSNQNNIKKNTINIRAIAPPQIIMSRRKYCQKDFWRKFCSNIQNTRNPLFWLVFGRPAGRPADRPFDDWLSDWLLVRGAQEQQQGKHCCSPSSKQVA